MQWYAVFTVAQRCNTIQQLRARTLLLNTVVHKTIFSIVGGVIFDFTITLDLLYTKKNWNNV